MDYPSGSWKYCSCGESYFRYDDGTGSCSACFDRREKAEIREDRRLKRLQRENKKLKKQLKETQND